VKESDPLFCLEQSSLSLFHDLHLRSYLQHCGAGGITGHIGLPLYRVAVYIACRKHASRATWRCSLNRSGHAPTCLRRMPGFSELWPYHSIAKHCKMNTLSVTEHHAALTVAKILFSKRLCISDIRRNIKICTEISFYASRAFKPASCPELRVW